MPVNQGNGLLVFKICVWIIVALTILGSIVFQDNLFLELSWTSRFYLFILVIGVTLYGGQNMNTQNVQNGALNVVEINNDTHER